MNTAPIGRKEAIRTPDPYVPNVVRYQLRYFPICGCKFTLYFLYMERVGAFICCPIKAAYYFFTATFMNTCGILGSFVVSSMRNGCLLLFKCSLTRVMLSFVDA